MTDLSRYTRHEATFDDIAKVAAYLTSQAPLAQGTMVPAFEDALCQATGAPYAVVVNSGTAALHLAYGLLFKPGQEVRMPAISFVATANAALYAGLTPQFLTVNKQTGLVEEDCEVGVELGGQPTGHRHLIVDACHSFRYVPDALVTVLSFHPAKHVTCGEGGVLLTSDSVIAERARLLRSHGRQGTQMVTLGFNYRMPDLNACLGLSQLSKVRERIAQRVEIAGWYDEALKDVDVGVVPHGPETHRHLYQIQVAGRDRIGSALNELGIGTAIHYPVIPDQPFYAPQYRKDLGYSGARWFADNTLTLPLFPQMTRADVDTVVGHLKAVL